MSVAPREILLALTAVTAAFVLSACDSLRSPPPQFPSQPTEPGSAAPGQPVPGQPPAAARRAKQFRLTPASTALVAQAHKAANSGDFGLAAATIERAMRIEPDNPLLWIELGRVRLSAGDFSQADSMGRKALSLATGDPHAQGSAWHLIADSLRARERNPEAADADRRADALAPR